MEFFPHPEYAEDQPYAKTILTYHVLERGFEAGSIVGSAIGAGRYVFSGRKAGALFWPTILRSTGTGAMIGTGLLAVGLVNRMWGFEEIEWKDRSWRLLENKGQNEVTKLSDIGQSAGALSCFLQRQKLEVLGWRNIIGRVGLGSMAGIAGYMVWRHGVKQGKFD